MFKIADRNLLVLSKNALENELAMQQEIEMLNEVLPPVELLQTIAGSSEIFDLNRCRTFKNAAIVFKRLQQKNLPSFVFLCNKN